MAGFLYYLPTAKASITAEQLGRAGLRYAIPGGFTPRGVMRGPDGGDGVVVAAHDGVPAHLVGYFPDRQAWRRLPQTDAECWAGWYTGEERPAPADLERVETLPGHRTKLGDGNSWLVPVALAAFQDGDGVGFASALPRRLELDDAGQWVRRRIKAAYTRLWEIAVAWFDCRVAQAQHVAKGNAPRGFEHSCFEDAWLLPAAVDALAVNYRVGPAECAALELLDDRTALSILAAVIDEPGRLELLAAEQKKTPDGCSTTPGGGDCCPDTAPRSPTCGDSRKDER